MTKGELVQRLARQFPEIRKEEARGMIDLFLDSMKEGLKSGETVEIRNFGVLKVRSRSARKARNPWTGSSVVAAPKNVPYFKQSRILKSDFKSGQAKG